MRNFGLPFSCFLLILAAAIALACGSSPRILESVSISPPSADANGSPVQFTATGNYNGLPFQVSPLTATWGVCYQGNETSGVSVSKNGLAQCAAGAAGTFAVWASAPSGSTGACPQACTACGGCGCQVTGTAQLTCP